MMLTKTYCHKLRYVHSWTLRARVFRRASSATPKPTNQFPFPLVPHPSPHQIFHLPKNASESDIKARYFDLVRIYHPDKADPSISPEDAHATFRSITAAYDSLRGKTPLTPSPLSANAQESRHRTTAEWRAMRTKREALYTGADEGWKDKVILVGLLATVVILVGQIFTTRRQALAEAVAQSRQLKTHRESPQFQQGKHDMAHLEAKGADKRLSG